MAKCGGKWLGWTLGTLAAATAGAVAVNAYIARRRPDLGPALHGEQGTYDWDGGRVEYTMAGDGPPLLLLHSHNAAASSYEVRRAFIELSKSFRVFAPDLPGYGRSERRARQYFAATYVRFIHEFTRDVVGVPAILVAPSVSGAQALVAAWEDPEIASHLVVVAPTGLVPARTTAPGPVRALGAVAHWPVWGQAVFNAVASRASIRRFLREQVYHDPWSVTHEMVDYAWSTAHQPNAINAPAAFLDGEIWPDARAAYEGLEAPLLVVWGEHDRVNSYEASAPLLSRNPRARVAVITNAGAAPYDEQPREFAEVLSDFVSGPGDREGVEP